jgi:hypothetical protein
LKKRKKTGRCFIHLLLLPLFSIPSYLLITLHSDKTLHLRVSQQEVWSGKDEKREGMRRGWREGEEQKRKEE